MLVKLQVNEDLSFFPHHGQSEQWEEKKPRIVERKAAQSCSHPPHPHSKVPLLLQAALLHSRTPAEARTRGLSHGSERFLVEEDARFCPLTQVYSLNVCLTWFTCLSDLVYELSKCVYCYVITICQTTLWTLYYGFCLLHFNKRFHLQQCLHTAFICSLLSERSCSCQTFITSNNKHTPRQIPTLTFYLVSTKLLALKQHVCCSFILFVRRTITGSGVGGENYHVQWSHHECCCC